MLGAFDRAQGDPELIQPRHEEMGAFMATAHAKFTGEIGCCIATSGGGTDTTSTSCFRNGVSTLPVRWSAPRAPAPPHCARS
jgi:thiamine pyrophosphate-dependent acetolactate synthase large subunit-like protein